MRKQRAEDDEVSQRAARATTGLKVLYVQFIFENLVVDTCELTVVSAFMSAWRSSIASSDTDVERAGRFSSDHTVAYTDGALPSLVTA